MLGSGGRCSCVAVALVAMAASSAFSAPLLSSLLFLVTSGAAVDGFVAVSTVTVG